MILQDQTFVRVGVFYPRTNHLPTMPRAGGHQRTQVCRSWELAISQSCEAIFFFFSSPFIISHFVPKSQVFFKNFFKFLVPNFGTPYQTFVRFTKQKKETLQSLYTIRLLRKLQFLQVHFSLKVREFFLNEQELR